MPPPKHEQEEARLAALYRYHILDTEDEQAFDDITHLVAAICDAPISVINLIDRDRQWFKSEVGLGVRETPLDISICAHAILQQGVFVVPDTLEDERFAYNPLVTGEPGLRFYAGALLESSDGQPLGTLCVLDNHPRELTERQRNALEILARQVMSLLELRKEVEQRREQGEYLNRLIGSSPDCIKTLALDGTILSISEGGLNLLEIPNAASVCGTNWSTFFWDDQETRDAFFVARDKACAGDMGRFQGFCATMTGKPKWWDVVVVPLFGADGKPEQLLSVSRDVTEHRQLEIERERLLEDQQILLANARARAEREALVSAVGAAINTAPADPEAILATTLKALGEGLHADRCYYVRYDQAKDRAQIGQEWYRAGLKPITGRAFKMSAYVVDRDPEYRAGNTHIVADTIAYSPDDAESMRALGVGALIRVPLQVGNEMTALGVTSREPRDWTEDEVYVIEAVASQLQPALNVARLQQRERNIASQLQDALVPPAPHSLPGMKLASFYRPALQEASVGGDFFDVFSIEKGCTALIVADLSGKGLHAASEVATCRNMARYALYTATSIADAVTSLNHLLVEHRLFSGFATAFIGVYNHEDRTLTYVNCGQEPGLLWRAGTGEIEDLEPTGPVLGGFGGGSYRQETVKLLAGDVLALFTDGMTEVGPNRRELLEVEGVRRLLLQNCAIVPGDGHDPHSIVDCLISDVDAFARGGAGDDIALLIGVVGN